MKPMEKDTKTHIQTIDGAQGVLWKSWQMVEGPEEDRDSKGGPTEST